MIHRGSGRGWLDCRAHVKFGHEGSLCGSKFTRARRISPLRAGTSACRTGAGDCEGASRSATAHGAEPVDRVNRSRDRSDANRLGVVVRKTGLALLVVEFAGRVFRWRVRKSRQLRDHS